MARAVSVGNVSSGNFDPAPAGTKVKAVVFEIEESVVKSNAKGNQGKPQAVVTVKITEDFLFAGSDGKQQNLKNREIRFNNVPLYDGDNMWQLSTFGEAVGWGVNEDGAVLVPDEGDLAVETQGKELVVQLGVRTANDGKVYNTVSRWLPANSKTSAGAQPASGGAASGNPWA